MYSCIIIFAFSLMTKLRQHKIDDNDFMIQRYLDTLLSSNSVFAEIKTIASQLSTQTSARCPELHLLALDCSISPDSRPCRTEEGLCSHRSKNSISCTRRDIPLFPIPHIIALARHHVGATASSAAAMPSSSPFCPVKSIRNTRGFEVVGRISGQTLNCHVSEGGPSLV